MVTFETFRQSWSRRRDRTFVAVGLAAFVTFTLLLLGCDGGLPPTPKPGPPTFSVDVEDMILKRGRAIERILPAATGGSGTLTYALSPEVPGLTFEPSDRTLSGTPENVESYRMTYLVRDEAALTDETSFTITVERDTLVQAILEVVAVDGNSGVARLADVPEPSGGPVVAVTGNRTVVAGGSIFLDLAPAPGATVDKLLVSIDGERFGYYEIDVPDAATYRLVGYVPFEFDPAAIGPGRIAVAAVDDGGSVGPTAHHPYSTKSVGSGEVQVTVSWDSDADLDLHVADPNGDEVYFGRSVIDSGGELDLEASTRCVADGVRTEHVAWTQGSPPPGTYEVRVSHFSNCGVAASDYVVRVYNHGRTTTFPGTFVGPGYYDSGYRTGRGDGRVITQFQVSDGPPPPRPPILSSTYRGSGDEVFVLNPDGEVLDDTLYTLRLDDASAEVYVIATAGNYHVNPRVDRLDLREAEAKGLPTATQEQVQAQPRPAADEQARERPWITEFNNDPPLTGGSGAPEQSLQPQSERPVAEGDRFTFVDLDYPDVIEIPATVRSAVTDAATTVAVWVADREWGAGCVRAEQCVTQEMVDALADSFFRPGADNDIHDWVASIFGAAWGPHENPRLIPPEAAGEIHILLFDVADDGIPEPGESRIVGFFFSLNNFRRVAGHPFLEWSNERLMFVIDSPFMVIRPQAATTTLAHEFQHMIHFYQKPVLRDASSETWLNEMASEVAEDLIADKMMADGPRGVAYDDPSAGEPRNRYGRLPRYNLYNDIQVTSWNGYLANYSINYALGAYLARTYGGAALFGDVVQSGRAGVGAIEGALRNQGHSASFVELLADWAAANLLSDNTEAPAPYRYNPGAWSTSQSADGTTFRVGSINLYNYRFRPPDVPARLALDGPYLHSLDSFNERTQPPHSNMYATLGRNTGTVRLTVSAATDNRVTVVVKE